MQDTLDLDGNITLIEPRAMSVLVYLSENAGKVVSSEEMIAEIWGPRYMGENPIYRCISILRNILKKDELISEYIQTVPKKGYRLIAKVSPPFPKRSKPRDTKKQSSQKSSTTKNKELLAKSDFIAFQNDHPTSIDNLERKPFASVLAKHIQFIFDTENPGFISNSAFVIQLYAPWGAGKTTVLKFLESELTADKTPEGDPKWLVSTFNAWRNQHLNPPWWAIMDQIYRGCYRSLKAQGKPSLWFKLGEQIRRYRSGALFAATTGFVLSVCLFVLAITFIFGLDLDSEPNWLKRTDSIGTILLTIGSIFSSILVFSKSISMTLLSGKYSSAREIEKLIKDPQARIRNHFSSMVSSLRPKIPVLFIDDLDRCRPEYVVSLLEGLQTLFVDTPVLYVVAADQRWISTCFEKVYKDFQGTITNPGQTIGYRFTEKVFQFTARIPRMTAHQQSSFWSHLLGESDSLTSKKKSESSTQPAPLDNHFAGAISEEDVWDKMQQAREQNKFTSSEISTYAALHLASTKSLVHQEHALSRFAPYVDRNPRSMKRLLNHYSILRATTLLENTVLSRTKLVRWAIISMKWPILAAELEKKPELIEDFYTERSLESNSKVVASLSGDTNLINVIKGTHDNEGILEVDDIRKCVGLNIHHN